MVLDRTEDSIDGSLERSETSVNSIDLKEVPGRTRLRSFLEVVLPLVLCLLQRSRLRLYLLFLAFLLGRSGRRASRCFFQLDVFLGSRYIFYVGDVVFPNACRRNGRPAIR